MIPVYDFLGYKLLEIEYKKDFCRDNSYVSIEILNDIFDEENNQYRFNVRISVDSSPEKESYFLFQSAFEINDQKWFEKVSSTERKSIFFSIVFPFIREKILAITSDMDIGLFIPVLNMREINLDSPIRLIRQNVKKGK